MATLKKIWNDSVGSNIIANIIVYILSYLVAILYNYYNEKELNFGGLFILSLIIFSLAFILCNMAKIIVGYRYKEGQIELDRALFAKIKNIYLPENGTIAFLRQFDFRGSFLLDSIKDLEKYSSNESHADFEFLHPKLDKLNKELLTNILAMQEIIALQTWNNNDVQAVPREWRESQPTRFQQVTTDLNNLANKIVAVYDLLIKNGRRILTI